MKFRHSKTEPVSSLTLDITPLVDVVFNMLIFFALTLNFAMSDSIKVNLPTSSSPVSKPPAESIKISIDKDGTVFYNEDIASLEQVKQYLRSTSDKRSVVIIRADTQVLHGKVVQVMDMAKSEGFSKLSIAVERKD